MFFGSSASSSLSRAASVPHLCSSGSAGTIGSPNIQTRQHIVSEFARFFSTASKNSMFASSLKTSPSYSTRQSSFSLLASSNSFSISTTKSPTLSLVSSVCLPPFMSPSLFSPSYSNNVPSRLRLPRFSGTSATFLPSLLCSRLPALAIFGPGSRGYGST